MVGKDKPSFYASHHVTAITFLIIGIITTSTLFAFPLMLNQNHIAIAQGQQLLNGTSFQMGNMIFSHHMASVNDVQLHYVIGGHGNPVVLLYGWPETWYEWRHVMPALAKNYTVIVPDLPGLGDSSKPTSYDTKTVAAYIHQLVTQLGFKTIFLVGHDVGSAVAYSYAAANPAQVKWLVVMDSAIPGLESPQDGGKSWWPSFFQVPDIPEALVQGHELIFLSWFYHNGAYNPAAITQADINEYVCHYSAPGGMRAEFEYYRAIPQDAIQNINYSKTKLTMPVLAVGGGYFPALGGNITMPTIISNMKILAQNVTGIVVPNTGHFIPEEQPDFVVKLLNNFFSGKPTTETGK